eukprot:2230725-Amphidinium_carterae.1
MAQGRCPDHDVLTPQFPRSRPLGAARGRCRRCVWEAPEWMCSLAAAAPERPRVERRAVARTAARA